MVTSIPARPWCEHQWICLDRCGAGRGGRSGAVLEGWELFCEPFAVGETVALEQKSNLKHCHAEVIGDVVGPDAGKHAGCYPVRLIDQGAAATLHIEPRRLARVLRPQPPRVLIMADTTTYRRMAKTQVGREDAVLEIGSAFGDCTRILQCHAGAAVGVDVAQELVKECRRRHPQCHFEWLDFREEPERLRSILRDLCSAGTLKVFVDVGGDRAAADVCKVLSGLAAVFCREPALPQPPLIVVKSRNLALACEAQACAEGGLLLDVPGYWARVATQPDIRSKGQLKKRRNRARKAMWAGQSEDGGKLADMDEEDRRWFVAKAGAEALRRRARERGHRALLGAWRQAAADAEARRGDDSRGDDCCAEGPAAVLRHFLLRLRAALPP